MLVQVAAWKKLAWLRHGFSTRRGGVSTVYRRAGAAAEAGMNADPNAGLDLRVDADLDLNLGWTRDDDPRHVAENRRRLVAAVWEAENSVGYPAPQLVTVRQVHAAATLTVSGATAVQEFVDAGGRALLESDGVMTRAPGVLLGIQTADCVPVLVADTRLRAVAAFHAGWRGTAARIVERGVRRMIAEFGSRPEDLTAAVGPAIGACCYSVGEEVVRAFTAEFSYGNLLFRRRGGDEAAVYLDLWEANRCQLTEAGVPSAKIAVVGECTGCAGLPGRPRYFSHRREQGFTGRMMSAIGIAEGAGGGLQRRRLLAKVRAEEKPGPSTAFGTEASGPRAIDLGEPGDHGHDDGAGCAYSGRTGGPRGL